MKVCYNFNMSYRAGWESVIKAEPYESETAIDPRRRRMARK